MIVNFKILNMLGVATVQLVTEMSAIRTGSPLAGRIQKDRQ